MTYTTLQWVAPELGRLGLLKNEDWVVAHSAEAVGMFGNQGLHPAASIMSVVNERAIDYVRQAPVLVLAASNGSSLHRRRDREFLARRWAHVLSGGPKLKEVLAHFDLPIQMRKLTGGTLAPSYWPTVQRLSKLHPSTLAQAIPERRQADWLRRCKSWSDRMASRYMDANRLIEWAALAIGRSDDYQFDVGDLADFAGSPVVTFDTRWNWEQARAAAERWHVQLQRMSGEEKFFQQHGIGFSDPIDYGELPIIDVRGSYELIALRSGEELFREGVAMHHCVSSYTREVLLGQSRIYSVREADKRVATFELTPFKQGWRMRQLKGPCNRRVSAPVATAVNAFLQSLDGAA